MANDESGELLLERRLDHQSGEAHAFYRNLQGPVRVGIEATGPIHRFERLLTEHGHELWIGDAAKIRASEVRKQKTDERYARLIVERELRQLLWHRHRLVCLHTMLSKLQSPLLTQTLQPRWGDTM